MLEGLIHFFIPAALAQTSIPLEVGIGTLSSISGGSGAFLANYLIEMYEFIVGAIGVIAAVMIMFNGMRWASAAGNAEAITTAKGGISSAVIGLIIALMSYVLLNAINPALVNFQSLEIDELKFAHEDAVGGDSASRGAATANLCNSCAAKKYTYFGDRTTAREHIVGVTFNDGAGHSKAIYVHEDAQTAYTNAFNTIKSRNEAYASSSPSSVYPINFAYTAGWVYRPNRNNPACLSSHSFGFAIDVNWNNNPNCTKKSSCYVDTRNAGITSNYCAAMSALAGKTVCDLPDFVINAFTSQGFSWGGNWKSLKDYMHFEWTGHGCSLM